LWGFANRALSILWLPILRDLGEVIGICEADYGTKVAKAVLRLSRTVLRLSGTIV
jgi:hypothetical protein